MTPRYRITQWNTYPARLKRDVYFNDAQTGATNQHRELDGIGASVEADLAAALDVKPSDVALEPVPPTPEPDVEPTVD